MVQLASAAAALHEAEGALDAAGARARAGRAPLTPSQVRQLADAARALAARVAALEGKLRRALLFSASPSTRAAGGGGEDDFVRPRPGSRTPPPAYQARPASPRAARAPRAPSAAPPPPTQAAGPPPARRPPIATQLAAALGLDRGATYATCEAAIAAMELSALAQLDAFTAPGLRRHPAALDVLLAIGRDRSAWRRAQAGCHPDKIDHSATLAPAAKKLQLQKAAHLRHLLAKAQQLQPPRSGRARG